MNDNIMGAIRLYDYLKNKSFRFNNLHEILKKLRKIESSVNADPELLTSLLHVFNYDREEDEITPPEIIEDLASYVETIQDCLEYIEEDNYV